MSHKSEKTRDKIYRSLPLSWRPSPSRRKNLDTWLNRADWQIDTLVARSLRHRRPSPTDWHESLVLRKPPFYKTDDADADAQRLAQYSGVDACVSLVYIRVCVCVWWLLNPPLPPSPVRSFVRSYFSFSFSFIMIRYRRRLLRRRATSKTWSPSRARSFQQPSWCSLCINEWMTSSIQWCNNKELCTTTRMRVKFLSFSLVFRYVHEWSRVLMA